MPVTPKPVSFGGRLNSIIAGATAGETLTTGDPVYLGTDGKYYMAIADSLAKIAIGVVIEDNAVVDGLIDIQIGDVLQGYPASTFTGAGTVVYLSQTVPGLLIETYPPDGNKPIQIFGTAESDTEVRLALNVIDDGVPNGIDIEEDDSSVVTGVSTLNFEGFGLTTTDEGSGKATIKYEPDAADVTFTPAVPGDWDAGDPGDVNDALDELAARIDANEDNLPDIQKDDSEVVADAKDINFEGAGLTVTDNTGNKATIDYSPDYTDISSNDAATDITGAQLETLSDGSNADALHTHNLPDVEDDDTLILADATVYNFTTGMTAVDAGSGQVNISSKGTGGGTGNARFPFVFGAPGTTKDKFLDGPANETSSNSTGPVMPESGKVVTVTISTETDATNDVILQIVKNATKGGAGVLKGGTQIGTDLTTDNTILDDVFNSLTGYTFNKLDRLAVYLKEGVSGTGTATDPVVYIYVEFDDVTAGTGGVGAGP